MSGDSASCDTAMASLSSLGPPLTVSVATVADGKTTLSVTVSVDSASVSVARELLLLLVTVEAVVVCSDAMSSELLELAKAGKKTKRKRVIANRKEKGI